MDEGGPVPSLTMPSFAKGNPTQWLHLMELPLAKRFATLPQNSCTYPPKAVGGPCSLPPFHLGFPLYNQHTIPMVLCDLHPAGSQVIAINFQILEVCRGKCWHVHKPIHIYLCNI